MGLRQGFIPQEFRNDNFGKLSQFLGFDTDNVSQEINANMSKSVLKDAAKMFISLNTYPLFYEKLYFEAINGTNTRTMTMILSNIIQKANQDFKIYGQKIFAKVSQMVGFEHISFQHEGNNSFMMMKNILGIKGEIQIQNMLLTGA